MAMLVGAAATGLRGATITRRPEVDLELQNRRAMKPSSHAALPAALRPHATRISCDAGATVFRIGDAAQWIWFVDAGSVRSLRRGRAGEEVLLRVAKTGEFFAEASLDSGRYHCEAVASEPSVLLRFPAATLRRLLESDPAFASQWIALLAANLRAARTRVERLSLKQAAERVRHLLVAEGRGAHYEVVVEGTLKDLARSLGLSHEALYRTLATMTRNGVIERRGKAIRLRQ